MSKDHAVECQPAWAQDAASCTVNWNELAARRLGRLVSVEHEYAVLREHFDRLRSEHDALLLANDDRLARMHALQASLERSHQLTIDLAGRCAAMQSSRSWRITAPFRRLSTQGRRMKHAVVSMLLRGAHGAHLGPVVARMSPGIHARIRARLRRAW
jgi:hypothetical protein